MLNLHSDLYFHVMNIAKFHFHFSVQITTWQFFFVLQRSDAVVIQTAVDIKPDLQTSPPTSIARQVFQQVKLH